jgi:hypothetical protein
MLSLEGPMTFASLEPGLKGPWPKDKYHEILAIQGQMINALGVFSGAFARLEPGWCKALAERSGMMHPAFVCPPLPFLPGGEGKAADVMEDCRLLCAFRLTPAVSSWWDTLAPDDAYL